MYTTASWFVFFTSFSILFCYGHRRSVEATVYNVGDASGWTLGTDYNSWTAGKSFVVDDSLVFTYVSGAHSVAQVSSEDYKSCSTSNAVGSDSSGLTTVSLKTTGTHYFICGIPGHCSGGMKVAVSVLQAKGSGGGNTNPGTSIARSSSVSLFPTTATLLVGLIVFIKFILF